ncbi:MptD family putative ECF transporter S component [Streptococcus pneumoniae]
MKELTLKDMMLTGAFSALYFLCVGLGTLFAIFFDHSGNMLYAPAFAAVLGGTVYLLLLAKIRKFGAITLMGIVMGVFFFLSGHFFASFLPGLIFGFLADRVAKLYDYRNKLVNSLSFVIFSFVNTGPILLMWFSRKAYISSLIARGKTQAYIERVMVPFTMPSVAWFVATVVVGAFVGALIGSALLKKHFEKAGIIS